MKLKFSTAWIASKQTRKQRKYRANAPLHLKHEFLSAHVSKDLRKKHNIKNIPVRKGDKVKIMRGKFKKKEGKIVGVLLKRSKVEVEGIQAKKRDGSNVNVRLEPSNLMIIELNSEDKKRMKVRTVKRKEVKKIKVQKEIKIAAKNEIKQDKVKNEKVKK
ncbi:50S ribosomal protein L24 [Candidatus Pacearchaeota archaeon CG10_big_fil_rev_8_21_14_0_10_32_14]|nr:MAG: 50S ribosomal protein L24 [Candidatus Pacearchaeota archaeon CG10_big_fil_rev_8_21_14_0_10_32_14]